MDAKAKPWSRDKRLSAALSSVFLLAMILIVFFPVRRLDFTTYDERFQLIDNPLVKTLNAETLKKIFTKRNQFGSYYPVRTLSFAVEHSLWGLHPKGYHLTNLALHCANVLLVFFLAVRLGGDEQKSWTAGIGAGILAVHPVVVEPVAWIGAREELLMTLGVLACVHAYMTTTQWHEKKGFGIAAASGYVTTIICGAAACLSSVLGAVTPLLASSWALLRPVPHSLRWKRLISGTAGLWILTGLTIFLKLHDRADLNPGIRIEASRSVFERLGLVVSTYWLNLKTLLWPAKLALLYPQHDVGALPIGKICLGLAAGVLSLFLFWICRRRRIVLFGFIWFFIALSPGSQILPHQFHRTDRLLYLPLAGLAIATGRGLFFLAKRKHGISCIGIAFSFLFAVWGVLSSRQLQTWQNGITLFQQCLRVDPESAVSFNNLGQAYKREGQLELAEKALWKAVKLEPDYFLFRRNLADLYRKRGQFAEAAYHYDRASELFPGWNSPLSLKRLSEEELSASITELKETLASHPSDADALDELAWLYATYDVPDPTAGQQAVRWAVHACELTKRQDPDMLHTLMTAYAKAGQERDMFLTGKEALRLAEEQGNRTLAERIEDFLASHQKEVRSNEPMANSEEG